MFMIFPLKSVIALSFGFDAYQPSQCFPVAARATVYSGIAHDSCALLARTISAISAIGFDCRAEGGLEHCTVAPRFMGCVPPVIDRSRCESFGSRHNLIVNLGSAVSLHDLRLSIASTARRISSDTESPVSPARCLSAAIVCSGRNV